MFKIFLDMGELCWVPYAMRLATCRKLRATCGKLRARGGKLRATFEACWYRCRLRSDWHPEVADRHPEVSDSCPWITEKSDVYLKYLECDIVC